MTTAQQHKTKRRASAFLYSRRVRTWNNAAQHQADNGRMTGQASRQFHKKVPPNSTKFQPKGAKRKELCRKTSSTRSVRLCSNNARMRQALLEHQHDPASRWPGHQTHQSCNSNPHSSKKKQRTKSPEKCERNALRLFMDDEEGNTDGCLRRKYSAPAVDDASKGQALLE